MKKIHYKSGYHYQLVEDYIVDIPIKPKQDISTYYISLSTAGRLTVWFGYCWDGPSGPTWDTRTFMRGSLVHDALYQLMREGHLNPDIYRIQADDLLRAHCKEDGMNFIRAWYVCLAVKWAAEPWSDPANKKSTHTAP